MLFIKGEGSLDGRASTTRSGMDEPDYEMITVNVN